MRSPWATVKCRKRSIHALLGAGGTLYASWDGANANGVASTTRKASSGAKSFLVDRRVEDRFHPMVARNDGGIVRPHERGGLRLGLLCQPRPPARHPGLVAGGAAPPSATAQS